MKKTKVISVRLSLESLQSCFDLCLLVGHPTQSASSSLSRAIHLLTSNLRSSGTLPSYTSPELAELTKDWASKINPSTLPSLELSSTSLTSLSSFTPLPFAPHKSEGHSEDVVEKQDVEEQKNERDKEDLEDEILKQIKEIELLEELDLLDKILIGG